MIVHLYLGYQWVNADLHKVEGTGWTDGGATLKGFWTNAVKIPEQGKPPIAFDWYRDFIQFMLDREYYTWRQLTSRSARSRCNIVTSRKLP